MRKNIFTRHALSAALAKPVARHAALSIKPGPREETVAAFVEAFHSRGYVPLKKNNNPIRS